MADTDETTRKFEDHPNQVGLGLQNLLAEVVQLRESVESRNRETRPLGETLELIRGDLQQLKADMQQVKGDLLEVKGGQEALRKEVRDGFALMVRKQNLLNNRLLDSEGDIVGLDQRIGALENRERWLRETRCPGPSVTLQKVIAVQEICEAARTHPKAPFVRVISCSLCMISWLVLWF